MVMKTASRPPAQADPTAPRPCRKPKTADPQKAHKSGQRKISDRLRTEQHSTAFLSNHQINAISGVDGETGGEKQRPHRIARHACGYAMGLRNGDHACAEGHADIRQAGEHAGGDGDRDSRRHGGALRGIRRRLARCRA